MADGDQGSTSSSNVEIVSPSKRPATDEAKEKSKKRRKKSLESLDRLEKCTLIPLHLKSRVWNALKGGFSEYKTSNKQLKCFVICNTCLNDPRTRNFAEINFGYSRSTSNVKGHLKAHHPAEYKKLVERIYDTPSISKGKETDFAGQDLRSMLPTVSDNKITQNLIRLVVNKHLTLSLVDSDEFRDLLYSLNSRFRAPSSVSLKEQMLGLMIRKSQGLVKFMKEYKYAAITHDSWTSKAKQTYSSLSFHFISNEFTLYSCPFDIMKLVGHTYAPAIANNINSMAAFRLITICFIIKLIPFN
jgi:hypothetical protein